LKLHNGLLDNLVLVHGICIHVHTWKKIQNLSTCSSSSI